MSAQGQQGVSVVSPGRTYLGKQGITYGAGVR